MGTFDLRLIVHVRLRCYVYVPRLGRVLFVVIVVLIFSVVVVGSVDDIL